MERPSRLPLARRMHQARTSYMASCTEEEEEIQSAYLDTYIRAGSRANTHGLHRDAPFPPPERPKSVFESSCQNKHTHDNMVSDSREDSVTGQRRRSGPARWHPLVCLKTCWGQALARNGQPSRARPNGETRAPGPITAASKGGGLSSSPPRPPSAAPPVVRRSLSGRCKGPSMAGSMGIRGT